MKEENYVVTTHYPRQTSAESGASLPDKNEMNGRILNFTPNLNVNQYPQPTVLEHGSFIQDPSLSGCMLNKNNLDEVPHLVVL
jgi:hypothetical protein